MVENAIKDLCSKFKNLPEHQKIIYTVNGVHYSEFVRISSYYAQSKYPQPIIIKDSEIDQNVVGHADFFAKVCMSNVIKTDSKPKDTTAQEPLKEKTESKPDAEADKENLINMKFQSNKDDIKMLNTIKKANAVAIIDDSQNNKYIISDGNCFINLKKCQEDKLPCSPVFTDKEIIFKKDDMSVKALKGYNKGCKRVVLELYDNTLEYISFKGVTKYSLSTQNIAAYENKSKELCLYSKHFLEIVGNKTIDVKIALKDKKYWLIITSEISKHINAATYERLHIARMHTSAD
ncbi:MAG: hypothetical protein AB7U45_04155 [Desulfamplus sp.]